MQQLRIPFLPRGVDKILPMSQRTRISLHFNDINGDSGFSEDFASELSKAFQIDEDPLVEELESSLREKSGPSFNLADFRNQRLSMHTHELERLSQRLKEAEERLRKVEEENEDMSQGPTPPISPDKSLPPLPTDEVIVQERGNTRYEHDKDIIREDYRERNES